VKRIEGSCQGRRYFLEPLDHVQHGDPAAGFREYKDG